MKKFFESVGESLSGMVSDMDPIYKLLLGLGLIGGAVELSKTPSRNNLGYHQDVLDTGEQTIYDSEE